MNDVRAGWIPTIVLTLFATCFGFIAPAAHAAPDLDEAWSLIPRNAYAAVMVPNVKRGNTDLTAMLEGMDRANAVLGPNPMETLLLNVGLTGALREDGAAAIVLLESPEDENGPQQPVFILPTNDAQAWMNENFSPIPGAPAGLVALKGDENVTVYARAVDKHVIFSPQLPVLEAHLASPRTLREVVEARIPEAARAPSMAGEVVLYASPKALQRFAREAMQQRGLWPGGAPVPAAQGEPVDDPANAPPAPFGLDDDDAIALMGLNFDPLGLGVRTVTAFSDGSISATLAQGGPSNGMGFGSLPNNPFFLAMSIDVQGIGGAPILERLSGGLMPLPEWLGTTKGVQIISSPSVLGLQGGLLNETAIVVNTDHPDDLSAFIAKEVREIPHESGAVKRDPTWQDGVKDFDGLLVNGFKVKHTWPTNDPTSPMIESLMFGRRGVHGFVGSAGPHLVITMSQRKDVYVRTAKAAMGEARTLGDNVMIQAMREWLPANADLEIFLGVGQFGQVFQQVRQAIPMDNVPIPQIDPKTKPIGFALAIDGGRMETGVVIPADVLALFFDQALDLWTQFAGGGLGGFAN